MYYFGGRTIRARMNMANIGLIDVDKTRFPNLALGKITAYHRSLGDNVEWANPMFGNYDRVYASKVFSFTPDIDTDCIVQADEVRKGGTGYCISVENGKEV